MKGKLEQIVLTSRLYRTDTSFWIQNEASEIRRSVVEDDCALQPVAAGDSHVVSMSLEVLTSCIARVDGEPRMIGIASCPNQTSFKASSLVDDQSRLLVPPSPVPALV